ncbi:hypothetical protein COO60DRAFT_950041 [Scenedesmus sp. NREL 46B-D3]|nr:hypothetical protein COO60DRAFT_950041 [Scenedesmus sp. NREL 46B-D3]
MDSLLDFDQEYLGPPWGPYGRDLTLGIVSLASKFILQVLNSTKVLNQDTYTELVHNRPHGAGLLTISNHTSTFDDPGLPCAMLPWHFFWTEHNHGRNRWTMCASDICFRNELLRQFFLNGKTLPVERGAGVGQRIMGVAARALARGEWLHIFPEGRVTPDGRVGPFRQGIGRLVCDAKAVAGGRDPIILPFFHSHMARVMPFKSSLPRAGHTVTVAVGQPLDLGHITCRCNQPDEDQQQVWRDIAAAMQHAVQQLEPQVPPNPNQVEERADVREWEERYQERLRQRRQQQLPEPVMMQQHAAVGAAAAAAAAGVGWQDLRQQQQQDGGLLRPKWQQWHLQPPESEEDEEQLTIASIGSSTVVQLSRRQQRQGSEWVWWRLLTAGLGQQQQQQPLGR